MGYCKSYYKHSEVTRGIDGIEQTHQNTCRLNNPSMWTHCSGNEMRKLHQLLASTLFDYYSSSRPITLGAHKLIDVIAGLWAYLSNGNTHGWFYCYDDFQLQDFPTPFWDPANLIGKSVHLLPSSCKLIAYYIGYGLRSYKDYSTKYEGFWEISKFKLTEQSRVPSKEDPLLLDACFVCAWEVNPITRHPIVNTSDNGARKENLQRTVCNNNNVVLGSGAMHKLLCHSLFIVRRHSKTSSSTNAPRKLWQANFWRAFSIIPLVLWILLITSLRNELRAVDKVDAEFCIAKFLGSHQTK